MSLIVVIECSLSDAALKAVIDTGMRCTFSDTLRAVMTISSSPWLSTAQTSGAASTAPKNTADAAGLNVGRLFIVAPLMFVNPGVLIWLDAQMGEIYPFNQKMSILFRIINFSR